MDDMNDDILRKKNTGEAGNRGEFGTKRHDDDEVALGDGDSTSAYTAIIDRMPNSEPYWQEPERVARVALGTIFEPGDTRVAALIKETGSAASALDSVMAPSHNGDVVDPDLSDLRDAAMRFDPAFVAKELLTAQRLGLTVALPDDYYWPNGLRDLGDSAPLVLWTKGELSLASIPEENVAIEGARASTGYGDHVTMELSATLSEQRTIMGTGSFGISSMALRSALASGSKPVLVPAAGHKHLTPSAHAALFERIADTGAIISEYSPNTSPTKARAVRRHKVLAALAGTTLIVEAGARSSSLSLASEAKALGRSVGAVPGPVTSAASMGTNLLIAEGIAKMVTSEDDVYALESHRTHG